MTAPPATPPRPAPRPGLEVRVARRPSVAFYRFLYAAVGEPWTWTVRRCLSDAELAAILADPRVEVNVLWADGVPAGYAELDRRAPPDVELAYFGLMPEFIGQGLGGYLLDWAIHHAWRPGRAASGCTPAISTTRGRSPSTRSWAFASTTGGRPRLTCPLACPSRAPRAAVLTRVAPGRDA